MTDDVLPTAVREDLAEPTLPDESLTIDAAEICDLVARFRAVRNAKRGSYIADAADLPADPVRVATALAIASSEAVDENGKHLNEDLVDLQAFVTDPPAVDRPLPDPQPPAESPVSASPPFLLLDAIRWRQAMAIAAIRGDPNALGNHNAIRGRWTAIGDARTALDLVAKYRESQVGGMIAMVAWLIALPIGAAVALLSGAARPSVVGFAAVAACWFASPWAGAALGRLTLRVARSTWMREHLRVSGITEVAAVVLLLGIVPFVVAIVVMTLATRLSLP